MSQGVRPAHQRVPIGDRPRRRLTERLVMRFPRLGFALTRAYARLSPRSPVRRAVSRYTLRSTIEALNRGDFDVVFALVPPDFVSIPPRELVVLGFEEAYHGREERISLQRRWVEELGNFEHRDIELIDCGNRLLILARVTGSGLASGAPFEREVGYLVTLASGKFAREEVFFHSHAEALASACLERSAASSG